MLKQNTTIIPIKGMNQDISPSKMPNDMAFHMLNMRLLPSLDNSLYGIVNEKGNKKVNLYERSFIDNEWKISEEPDYDKLIPRQSIKPQSLDKNTCSTEETSFGVEIFILGVIETNNGAILFSKKSDYVWCADGNSKLYKSKQTLDYIIYVTNYKDVEDSLLCTTIYEGDLNFSRDNLIEGIFLYETEDVLKIYWVDGLNQPRVANISDKALERRIQKFKSLNNTPAHLFNFVPELLLEENISVVKQASGGLFLAGTILYGFTYFNKYLLDSRMFYLTPVNYICDDHGASPELVCSCSFNITVDNLDTNFDYIRIYSIYRPSLNYPATVKRLVDIKITDLKEGEAITYTDGNLIGEPVDSNYLLFSGGDTFIANTLTTKDNTLFLGNIINKRNNIDKDILDCIKKLFNYELGLYTITSGERNLDIKASYYITNSDTYTRVYNIDFITDKEISLSEMRKYTPEASIEEDLTIYGLTIVSSDSNYKGTFRFTISPENDVDWSTFKVISLNITYNDNTRQLFNLPDEIFWAFLTEDRYNKLTIFSQTPESLIGESQSTGLYWDTSMLPETQYINYSGNLMDDNSKVTTFRSHNVYRIGVVFLYTDGSFSNVIYLQDKYLHISPKNYFNKNPYRVILNADLSRLLLYDIIEDEDKIAKLKEFYSTVKKVLLVMVLPTYTNRSVIASGILCPTLYNINLRIDNAPYAFASWKLRPFLIEKSDIESENSNNILYITDASTEDKSFSAEVSLFNNYSTKKITDTSIQTPKYIIGKTNTKVGNSYIRVLIYNVNVSGDHYNDINLRDTWKSTAILVGGFDVQIHCRILSGSISKDTKTFIFTPGSDISKNWMFHYWSKPGVPSTDANNIDLYNDFFDTLTDKKRSDASLYYGAVDFTEAEQIKEYEHFKSDKFLSHIRWWLSNPEEGEKVYLTEFFGEKYEDIITTFEEVLSSSVIGKGANYTINNGGANGASPYSVEIYICKPNSTQIKDKDNTFYIDLNIVTFNSPDINRDTPLSYIPKTSNCLLKVSKLEKKTSFYNYEINIDSETSLASSGAIGLLDFKYGNDSHMEYNNIPLWQDISAKSTAKESTEESTEEMHQFNVYLFNKEQLSDYIPEEDDSIKPSKIKTKKISNVRVLNSSYDNSYILSTTVVNFYNRENKEEMIAIADDNYYTGNREFLLVEKNANPLHIAYDEDYKNKFRNSDVGDISTANTLPNNSVTITYKSTHHLVLNLESGWYNNYLINNLFLYGDLFLSDNKTYKLKEDFSWQEPDELKGLENETLASKETITKESKTIEELRLEHNEEVILLLYGDTSESVLSNSIWIPISLPMPFKDSNAHNILKGNLGDSYYMRWDCLKTVPLTPNDTNQVIDITSFYVESYINLDGRYDSHRGKYDNLEITDTNFNLINDVYSQLNVYRSYSYSDSYVNTVDNKLSSVIWSLTKTLGEEVDLYTKVIEANIRDLDGNKGLLLKLINYNNNLFAILDKGISLIIYNDNYQILTEQGLPIEIANSGKVGGVRYLVDGIGCLNKASIQLTSDGIYFVDNWNKDIFLFNGLNVANLSVAKGMHTWVNKLLSDKLLWEPDDFNNVKTTFSKSTGDVYFITKKECLAYNELLLSFTSFYKYGGTPYMFNIQGDVYQIKNVIDDRSIYKMFAGEYNKIYDNPVDYSITVLPSVDGITDKVFSNVSFRADAYVNDGYNSDITFNNIKVWNEYLNTGDVTLIYNNHATLGNNDLSGSTKATLKKKFRSWHCDIPRNKYDKNNIKVTGRRDRIRNPWTYVELKYDSSKSDEGIINNNHKNIIKDITVDYYV